MFSSKRIVDYPDILFLINMLSSFLRIGAIPSNKIWTRLLKPPYADYFVSLVQRYAIRFDINQYSILERAAIDSENLITNRTMKATVKDELTIPKQTRYLVPIEMGRVERHVCFCSSLDCIVIKYLFD